MSSIDSNKILAGIGSILLLFGFVPGGGWAIGIVGLVLFLLGIKGYADYYRDDAIYHNAFTGAIYYGIGLAAAAVAIWGLSLGNLFGAFTAANILAIALGVFIFVIALVFAFVFFVLASSRIRPVMRALGQKSGMHLFETAGLLFFIGAVTTIIVVGLALLLVAWLLATIAFLTMKTQQQPPSYTAPPPPPTATPTPTAQAARYCPNCGAAVDATATFCPNCGKQLPPT